MKKVVASVLMMALFSSVPANSEVVLVDQGAVYDSSMTEATLEVALASAYVWRGQVYNNDAVFSLRLRSRNMDLA